MAELSILDYLYLLVGAVSGIAGLNFLVVYLGSAWSASKRTVSFLNVVIAVPLLLLSYFLIGLVL